MPVAGLLSELRLQLGLFAVSAQEFRTQRVLNVGDLNWNAKERRPAIRSPHVAGVPTLTFQLHNGRAAHSPGYRLPAIGFRRFQFGDHLQSYQN